MAPAEPHQKRKRGRPPGTTKTAKPASDGDPRDDQPRQSPVAGTSAEAYIAPRKRGRPRKSVDSATQDEPSGADQVDQTEHVNTAPKKRGRPPKVRDAEQEEENTSEARPRKRKRAGEAAEAENGREDGEGSSKRPRSGEPQVTGLEERSPGEPASRQTRRNRQYEESPAQPSAQERQSSNGQAGKPKGRPGRKPAARAEQQAKDETTQERSARQSRRERRSADDKPWWAAEVSPTASGTSKQPPGRPKAKRGRPSLAELSVSKAQNKALPTQAEQGNKKPRGRPPRASNEAASPNQDAQPPSTKHPKPSKNRLNRRPSDDIGPSPSNSASAAAPDHLSSTRHLTTLTRHIPRATIASKWSPLDTPSITAVSSLLHDASLPILHRLRDRDARHAQAQSILRTFAARLQAKLVKGMPFPPASVPSSTSKERGKRKTKGSHEVELDFEKTVDAIAGLEKALDPLLHSVVLLKAEKEREERELEREYEVLRRLEGNARAQVRGWREGMGRGREHVLLGGLGGNHQNGGRDGEGGDRGLEAVVVAGGGSAPGDRGAMFKDLQEEELLALSQQIGSHMESMKSNLGQIKGVLPAVAKTRAALQGTLCEYLDQEQYEQVLLG